MNKTYSNHPRNIRFNDEILEISERYILANPDINFSALVRVAVGSFLASKGYY
jgi:predicted DNA-binding ribbon-helix-helix protein